jgi:transcriptional regulator with XRE-family HTH domain
MNTSEAKEVVSQSVLKAIAYCGGSQMRLAKKAGLSQGAISKYVRKESLPTGVTAKQLVEAVDGTQSAKDFAPHIFQ